MNEKIQDLLLRIQSTADFGYVIFDSINDTNALGDNALHCVCVWGDLEAAKLLVENGINVNQCGEHGFTPLNVADDFGFREIVDYLIANGADPSVLGMEPTFDRDLYTFHMQRLGEQIQELEKQVEAVCGCNAQLCAPADAAKRRG
jgi:ankyrin repeat protein